MARLTFDGTDLKKRGSLRRGNWCLCVGAGISEGFLPSWAELTRGILNASLGVQLDNSAFRSFATDMGWGFDAWIQAGLNGHSERGKTVAEFAGIVEDVLYEGLRDQAAANGVERSLITAFNTPHLLRKNEFAKVFDFLAILPGSVVPLARLLLACERGKASPNAVITFSYDTVLETFIRMLQIKERAAQAGRHEFPPMSFRRVTGAGIDTHGIVPIIHIHGCVTPRSARSKRVPHDTRDVIIGPESSYLQLAGSSFSWGQTTFLHYALNDSLVLVGHSLSDPNLRRWLAWSATVRSAQSSRVTGTPHKALPHVWLRLKPRDRDQKTILQTSVLHLGLRIAWLESWAEIDSVLRNLLALDTAKKEKPKRPANNRLESAARKTRAARPKRSAKL